MQRLLPLIVSVTIFWIVGPARIQAAQIEPLFDVHLPTVVAFFPPISQAEMTHGESNESLDDFRFYAESARVRLAKADVDFHEVFAH